MSIRIKAKKVIERGEFKYEILDVDALKEKDLPVAYMRDQPNCHFVNSFAGKSLVITNNYTTSFTVGNKVHKEDFEALLEIVQQAGERLRKVNEAIERERKRMDWQGQIEFHI